MNELHLFAGCGGGILGGMLLGHTCVCAVEIVPYRRKALLQRQRDGILPRFPIWDDIRTFGGKPWHGKVDIVCGGFPCQNISPSGDRTGISGKKSGLWKEMARVVREVGPAYVLVENAATLVVRGLGTVLGDLAAMGFNAKWGVFGASDAIWLDGTPVYDHERLRCFIAATNANRLWELQSKGRIRISDSVAASAYANGKRYENQTTTETFKVHEKRNSSPFERERRGITMPTTAANNGWWANEPGVGRMVYGMANRVDRLEAIGDGQVPAVVKLAWESLIAT